MGMSLGWHEAWGVGAQIPGRGAGLDAVSCLVPLWILGHGAVITKALSLVRAF